MTSEIDWDSIHCGGISRDEILEYVRDADWQEVRIGLLGKANLYKFHALRIWLEQKQYSRRAQVQVTNYINALRRGGVI